MEPRGTSDCSKVDIMDLCSEENLRKANQERIIIVAYSFLGQPILPSPSLPSPVPATSAVGSAYLYPTATSDVRKILWICGRMTLMAESFPQPNLSVNNGRTFRIQSGWFILQNEILSFPSSVICQLSRPWPQFCIRVRLARTNR